MLKLIKNMLSRYAILDYTSCKVSHYVFCRDAYDAFKLSANKQSLIDKWRNKVILERDELII